MTFYALKPRFQALLRLLVAPLPRIGVTANMVTIVGALGSVLVGGLVAWRADSRRVFLIIPVSFLARMGLNAIDGMLDTSPSDSPCALLSYATTSNPRVPKR